MKILLVEDEREKAEKIRLLITGELDSDAYELTTVETVNDAIMRLGDTKFDLCIVDLVLPQVKNGEKIDATMQWCELIENHLTGRIASWIVMTGYSEIAASARHSFAHHDVAVIPYDNSRVWEGNLVRKLRDTYETRPLDFVVVCALEKERRGFQMTQCILGERTSFLGLDCQPAKIGNWRGMIVTQPSPGMISAAIVATKALTAFRPQAVAMAGICGGREGETRLGALIVPDLSWNYQSGKFKEGKLTPDLLHVLVTPTTRTGLDLLCTDENSSALRNGLMNSDLAHEKIQLAPMVSGSQVVADKTVSEMIGDQGRKVAGIDMEVASIYFAARDFFDGGGIYFAAKTVVDLANPYKDDRYHEYGCALSARFVTQALESLLSAEPG